MAAIQNRKFQWLRTPTAWEQAQKNQKKRRAMVREFLSGGSAASNAFASATAGQAEGAANLAAKAASKRIAQERAAKQQADKVDKLV